MSEVMKANGIQIFENKEFGKVRVTEINGEPWFVVVDVCKALEIKNGRDACSRLDEDEKGVALTDTLGGKQEVTTVNEPGLYSLVLGSRKPEAKQFKRWITHEVIPSIRKHGGYIHGQEELTPSELMAKAILLAQKTIEEREQRIAVLETTIEEQKPKVAFADRVSNTDDLVDMGDMAKLITDRGIEIGRNRLFKFLRKKKILMSKNIPYQQYITQEYFVVKETVKETDWGDKVFRTTYITGKGQLFVYKKVRESFDKGESFWTEDSDEQLVPA